MGLGAGALALFKGGDDGLAALITPLTAMPASMAVVALSTEYSSRAAGLTPQAKLAAAGALALGAAALPVAGPFATALSLCMYAGKTLGKFVTMPEKNASTALAVTAAVALCAAPLPGGISLQMLGAAVAGGFAATEAAAAGQLRHNSLPMLKSAVKQAALVSRRAAHRTRAWADTALLATKNATSAVLHATMNATSALLLATQNATSALLLATKNAKSACVREAVKGLRWARPKLDTGLSEAHKAIKALAAAPSTTPELLSNLTVLTQRTAALALEDGRKLLRASLKLLAGVLQSAPVQDALKLAPRLVAAFHAACLALGSRLKQDWRVVLPWVLAAAGVATQS